MGRLASAAWTCALVCAAVASPPVASADCVAHTFSSLRKNADAVVVGEIVSVEGTLFRFQVADLVWTRRAGTRNLVKPGTHVEVKKFVDDDLCGRRWTAYATGQKAVLFVRREAARRSQKTRRWLVLGSANEGELPVVGSTAFLGRELVDDPQRLELSGGTFVGKAIAVSALVQAIKAGKPLPGTGQPRVGL